MAFANQPESTIHITRSRFQWWWLIWGAAGICIFLCGALLGAVSSGGPGASHGFLKLLAPAFGGRDKVTILAVGVDKSEGRGLADTVIVLSVWPKTGEIAALSIPRDSRVEIPGVGERRINASHSFGGLQLTIQTVEMLLGAPIDYYIEVSVQGLAELVDAIGGIDIDVEKRMHYRDRSQNLNIDLQPGPQHLNGEQAVGYVRFRHDAMGDLGRVERQRKFLRIVAQDLLSPENVGRLPKLADTFISTVETNLTARDILSLKHIVEQAGPEAIRMATLPGEPRMVHGQSLLVLDPEKVQETVDRVLWGEGIRVTVLNATDIPGLAGQIAEMLEEHGYEVMDVGNAERKSARTLILDHRAQARRAERVAALLGGAAISPAPDGENPADVTIVLGADMGSKRR